MNEVAIPSDFQVAARLLLVCGRLIGCVQISQQLAPDELLAMQRVIEDAASRLIYGEPAQC